MATFKLGDNCYGVTGTVSRAPQVKTTKNGKTYVQFSVYAGKRDDESKIYVNCRAWQPLAGFCVDLQQRDNIFCIGRIETYEWEGKEYSNLILDWFNSPAITPDTAEHMTADGAGKEPEWKDDDDDGDLPF